MLTVFDQRDHFTWGENHCKGTYTGEGVKHTCSPDDRILLVPASEEGWTFNGKLPDERIGQDGTIGNTGRFWPDILKERDALE